MPPRSARRFTRANIVSAETEVSGVPSIAARKAGEMLALQRRPPGMNSAAWLRTPSAIASKAADSISCTSDFSSASASMAARMRSKSSLALSARRFAEAVCCFFGVVRSLPASKLVRRHSEPSMADCGLSAASSSQLQQRGHRTGQTSRMWLWTSLPGSIARSSGQLPRSRLTESP